MGEEGIEACDEGRAPKIGGGPAIRLKLRGGLKCQGCRVKE